MADPNWTVKTDPEFRDHLQALVEGSGLTGKDFLVRLVASYEADQARESMGQVRDIETLRHHLARIEETFINLAKGAQDRQELDAIRISQADEEATQAKAAAMDAKTAGDKAIAEAQALVEAAREEASHAREAAEADIQSMRDTLTQAQEAAQKDIQNMQEALTRARDAQQQSARLAALAEEAASAAKAKCAELEDMANRAEEYRRDAERARAEAQEAKDALARAVKQAGLEKERAAERADIEKEKTVLAVQRESMNEVSKLREALAQVREEKAALEVSIARAGADRQPESGRA